MQAAIHPNVGGVYHFEGDACQLAYGVQKLGSTHAKLMFQFRCKRTEKPNICSITS